MTSLTISLLPQDLKKARVRAKSEGFKTPSDWVTFLVERHLILEESPRLAPAKIVSDMNSTGLYKKKFLLELEKALEYADSAAQ